VRGFLFFFFFFVMTMFTVGEKINTSPVVGQDSGFLSFFFVPFLFPLLVGRLALKRPCVAKVEGKRVRVLAMKSGPVTPFSSLFFSLSSFFPPEGVFLPFFFHLTLFAGSAG